MANTDKWYFAYTYDGDTVTIVNRNVYGSVLGPFEEKEGDYKVVILFSVIAGGTVPELAPYVLRYTGPGKHHHSFNTCNSP